MPVAASAMPHWRFGQAGPKYLRDCVMLVLNSKLYPEIRQNNTNCTA